MKKMIVIGLDGATFSLLKPWIKNGDLPNLDKLITGGAHAVMESCLPPVTCPNWKCYSTGKNPGKLGVFWWEKIDVFNRTIESVRYAEHIKSKEIWDLMNDQGLRTAVINMPTTFPPRKLNGCMIAGGPDCPNENFTFPQELEREIKNQFDYKIHPEGVVKLKAKDPHAVKEIFKQIQQVFAVTRHIMKRDSYDFIHMTIFCTSIIQHFLWDDDIVKKVWAYIDKEIGILLLEMPEDHGVVIMSDHGMRTVSREFYINNWFAEKGYLTVKKRGEHSPFRGENPYKKKLVDFLDKLGLKSSLKKMLHLHGSSRGANIFGGDGSKGDKANMIDWDKSRVIASGQGPVYIIGADGSGAFEAIITQIINDLRELKDPLTGKYVIDKIFRKEEVYPIILSKNAPEIILIPEKNYRINGDIKNLPVFVDCQRWAAENDPPGIFIAYGNDIKSCNIIPGITITDLAPTILHWMNIPVPDDMDGRVLSEIFKEDAEPYLREVKKYRNEDITDNERADNLEEEEEMVKKRLKELGYLS